MQSGEVHVTLVHSNSMQGKLLPAYLAVLTSHNIMYVGITLHS